MKKAVIISIIVLAIGQTSFAQKAAQTSTQTTYRPFNHLSSELELTARQKRSIQHIRTEAGQKQEPLKKRIAELQNKLVVAARQKNPSKKRIKHLVRQIEETEILIKENGIETMFAIQDILTRKQRAKLEDLHLFNNFFGM